MSDFGGVVAQVWLKVLGEYKTLHKCTICTLVIMMDYTKEKKFLNNKISLSFFNIFLNGKPI